MRTSSQNSRTWPGLGLLPGNPKPAKHIRLQGEGSWSAVPAAPKPSLKPPHEVAKAEDILLRLQKKCPKLLCPAPCLVCLSSFRLFLHRSTFFYSFSLRVCGSGCVSVGLFAEADSWLVFGGVAEMGFWPGCLSVVEWLVRLQQGATL